MNHPHPSQRTGFRPIELVVVAAILLVLFALLLPALRKFREASNRASCKDHLRRIGEAIHGYAQANTNNLPPMLGYDPKAGGWGPFWFSLYPHLGEGELYRRASGCKAGWEADNYAEVVSVLLCPSDGSHDAGRCTAGAKGWAGTSYAPNYLVFATGGGYQPAQKVYTSESRYRLDTIPDGTAQTIAVVERFASFPEYHCSNAALYPMDRYNWGMNASGSAYGAWGTLPPQTRALPTGVNAAHPYRPNSAHSACQVLMMDVSVKPVEASIKRKVWDEACVPNDGTAISSDW